MTVSVITSVLNGAAVLRRCIDSVAEQTYPCEHIIVDGGSRDGSADLARASGLMVVEAPGSSISGAFNLGIRYSSGDEIGILNADDWLESDAVERSSNALSQAPWAGFSFSSGVLHFGTYSLVVRPRSTDNDLRSIAMRQMPFLHITSFVRRTVYERYGGFDSSLRVAMDFEWYARVCERGVLGVHVPGVIAHARAGGKSSHLRSRLVDYFHVLSGRSGKLQAAYLVAKYGLSSVLYTSVMSQRVWRKVLAVSSNRQLVVTTPEKTE